MTDLLFDIGNSMTKVVLARAGEYQMLCVIESTTEALLAFDFKRLNLAPNRIGISNVAKPEYQAILLEKSAKTQAQEVCVMTTLMGRNHVNHIYSDPKMLGVDRWMAILGGQLHSKNHAFAVASFGTAITFDVVDDKGLHQGGHILPNSFTIASALLKNTEQIFIKPLKAAKQSKTLKLGHDTQGCVQHGVDTLIESYVRQINQLIVERFGKSCILLVTGRGIDTDWLAALSQEIVYDEFLLFKGMQSCFKTDEL